MKQTCERWKPSISVIVPCHNEARFLGVCLDSILASDYPAECIEILVADGISTDGSRELVANYSRQYSRVRMIDNPARITPVGLNRAIDAARGEVIVRLDAHSAIASDYLRRGVKHLDQDGADNVGGAMRTIARDHGPFAQAIRYVLSHPFGVGNSHFRTEPAESARWVDTVFGGCWKREVFERVGRFNEKLKRGQDMEFNLRLARAGGRILLASDMRSYYYARATLAAFLAHNWTNGVWAILPFAYSTVIPVRARHLIPLLFALALLASAAGAFLGSPWLLAAVAGFYGALSLAVSGVAVVRERNPRLGLLLPPTFAALHLAYGAGSVWGAVQFPAILIARWFQRSTTA
jgi:succinoglycan biosynthesis protein ExoA